MIIYNVTIKIDLDVHDAWLRWMRDEHILRVLETGCFVSNKYYRVLEENTTDGITYAFQYSANNMTDYFDYKANHADRLKNESQALFPNKFTTFSTLLKEM